MGQIFGQGGTGPRWNLASNPKATGEVEARSDRRAGWYTSGTVGFKGIFGSAGIWPSRVGPRPTVADLTSEPKKVGQGPTLL